MPSVREEKKTLILTIMTGAMPKKSKKDKSSSSEGDNRKLKSDSESDESKKSSSSSESKGGVDDGENRFMRCWRPPCPGDYPGEHWQIGWGK